MIYTRVADLHIHTTASDGAYSLAEVACLARQADLEVISVTDHDSVSAVEQSAPRLPVEVIPGVELSAELGAREVHILGYYMNPSDERLQGTLTRLQQKRRERIDAILTKLAEFKIDIDPQEVLDVASGASVGRLHVAELLIDKGHAASLYEAFRYFLGPEGKAFVPKTRFSVAEAIEILHAAGGAAVLAHPGIVFAPVEIRSFARDGLDGIEAYYPRHAPSDVSQALALAEELSLVVTGGSDFHGRRSTDLPIGAARVTREEVDKLYQRSRRYAAGRVS
jgi:predicted metal-dependent phosphoesterase TrpH